MGTHTSRWSQWQSKFDMEDPAFLLFKIKKEIIGPHYIPQHNISTHAVPKPCALKMAGSFCCVTDTLEYDSNLAIPCISHLRLSRVYKQQGRSPGTCARKRKSETFFPHFSLRCRIRTCMHMYHVTGFLFCLQLRHNAKPHYFLCVGVSEVVIADF